MNSGKRRQNRIQGGINQQLTPRRGGASRGMPFQKTPSSIARRQATSPESFDGTLLGSRLSDDEPSPHRQFVFQDVNQKTREVPKVIMITEPGEKILSEEPTGISKIIFEPNFLDPEFSEWCFNTLLYSLPWEEQFAYIKGEKYLMPRKMCWFGPMDYKFSGSTLKASMEWDGTILAIHEQMKQKLGYEFNSVLANLYECEHNSVGWHSDNELLMGVHPEIASVSLGETRTFELRKKPPPEENYDFTYMQHFKIPLPSGSLLIMSGTVQEDWQHRVPKEYHSRKPRINLTFRNVYQKTNEESSSSGNK